MLRTGQARRLAEPRFTNWLSNISVGFIVGGGLAVLLTDNPLELFAVYAGAFMACFVVTESGEEGS